MRSTLRHLITLTLVVIMLSPLPLAAQVEPATTQKAAPTRPPNDWAIGLRLGGSPGGGLGALGGLGGLLGGLTSSPEVLLGTGLGSARLELGLAGSYRQIDRDDGTAQSSDALWSLRPSLGAYYPMPLGPAAQLYVGLRMGTELSNQEFLGADETDVLSLLFVPTVGLEYVLGRRLGLALETGLLGTWRSTETQPQGDGGPTSNTELGMQFFGSIALRFYL